MNDDNNIPLNVPNVTQIEDSGYGGTSSLTPTSSGGNFYDAVAQRWTNEQVTHYINDRFTELKCIAETGSALSFVLIAAFTDFLSCAVSGKKSTASQLKMFCADVVNFSVGCDCDKISNTLADILRNGLIHNFSVNPPGWVEKVEHGQVYEVILTHRKNGVTHRNFTVDGNKLTLVAEDFVAVLRNYIGSLYSDDTVRANMVVWFQNHPPIVCLLQDTLVVSEYSTGE